MFPQSIHAGVCSSFCQFVPVKVGDFGMSRDLADEDYYFAHGGVVPVKWAAIEVSILKELDCIRLLIL